MVVLSTSRNVVPGNDANTPTRMEVVDAEGFACRAEVPWYPFAAHNPNAGGFDIFNSNWTLAFIANAWGFEIFAGNS
jgi:hypothetical protein